MLKRTLLLALVVTMSFAQQVSLKFYSFADTPQYVQFLRTFNPNYQANIQVWIYDTDLSTTGYQVEIDWVGGTFTKDFPVGFNSNGTLITLAAAPIDTQSPYQVFVSKIGPKISQSSN
jgi:hypothetical protein